MNVQLQFLSERRGNEHHNLTKSGLNNFSIIVIINQPAQQFVYKNKKKFAMHHNTKCDKQGH